MITRAVIQRYLEGKATEEELRLLQNYLGEQDLSLLKEWMAGDWDHLPDDRSDLPAGISQDMLQRIKQEIARPEREQRKKLKLGSYWAVAAGMLLIVSIGLWLFWPASSPQLIHRTAYGEWETLHLPDGSWVKLNANSEIRYAANWKAGEDRQVWLDGEAFFQVQKQSASGTKFQVITKDLQVEVLGTSFNVNSREIQTDVFLEEGQIRLSMGAQEEMLKPGDFVAYSARKKAVVKRQNAIPAEVHTSWKDGVLIMKDKTIAEILRKLEEIYGVAFDVRSEALLTHIKTVAVPMDKLEITVPVLERTFEVKITKQGDQLVIQ